METTQDRPAYVPEKQDRCICFCLRRGKIGWRLWVSHIPIGTVRNHHVLKYEEDVGPMVAARIETELQRYLTGVKKAP